MAPAVVARISLAVSDCAILAEAGLFFAAAPNFSTAYFFTVWTIAPYAGQRVLALVMARSLAASVFILGGTVAMALVTIACYCAEFVPDIVSRLDGTQTLCPVGMLGQCRLMLPELQWIFVGLQAIVGCFLVSGSKGPEKNAMLKETQATGGLP